MKIKKYIAKNMREALLQIKEELGADAVILKTRKLPKKVFGLGAQEEVEVTAGIDDDIAKPEQFQPLKMNNLATGVYSRPRSSNIIDLDQPDAPVVHQWVPPRNDSLKGKTQVINVVKDNELQIEELQQNIKELKSMVQNMAGTKAVAEPQSTSYSFTGAWNEFYKKFLQAEVKAEIAGEFLKKICGNDLLISSVMAEKKIINDFNSFFPVAGPLKLKKQGPSIIAFVGPTGSGKTTTLAKLAAHCCLNKNKKVSIITADTYRIAAIEQVRMFADIIKVNLQVVFSPDEIPNALSTCASDDIVLVDTAGRCQKNSEHMEDLKELLEALKPDEIHLVLSATTKDSDLLEIVERYKTVNINRLLFTKLDETSRIGNIFNLVNFNAIPVSYFTFGQSVPDDIELAQPNRYLQRLWG